MDAKQRRKHLSDYTDAAREIELAGVAIKVLEGLRSAEGVRCIKLLEAMQQRQIRALDAAAANLGAPYGA